MAELSDAIVQQYNDGATYRELAESTGTSIATVSRFLKKKGVTPRARGRKKGSKLARTTERQESVVSGEQNSSTMATEKRSEEKSQVSEILPSAANSGVDPAFVDDGTESLVEDEAPQFTILGG